MASAELVEASEREAQALEGRGRVLVRPSGTEQLVRVMVEAPTEEEAAAVCERLVGVVQAVATPV
jgi:phosphoglucosamine mutase